MEVLKAMQIAEREWGKIRVSLIECGDIGEFESQYDLNTMTPIPNVPLLIKDLLEMEKKFATCGYFTLEASNVFFHLALRAGERLGLNPGLARSFGGGYCWVRSGCLNLKSIDKRQLIKQMFFYKLFFPIGALFNWDFNSKGVQAKLKLIYYTFNSWQDNPPTFNRDVIDFREQLDPLWKVVTLNLGYQVEFTD